MSDRPASQRVYRLLELLENVQEEKPGQWNSRCPCHDDNKNSLAITANDTTGKLALNCHAGCKTNDVLVALNQPITILFPERPKRGKKSSGGNSDHDRQILATYDYHQADGTLAFQVVRYEPKDFRQRKPRTDGKPGWLWSVKSEAKVPYRLPRILASLSSPEQSTQPIFIVEGEKDVHNLESLDPPLVATCNPGGAGKWLATPAFREPFARRHVVLLPDNDDPGRQHAQDVARKLHDVAASIKILELPGLTPKSDVSDWIVAGGTSTQLLSLASLAAPWKPSDPLPIEADDDPHRLAGIFLRDYRRVIYWRDEWYLMGKKDKVYRRLTHHVWRATIGRRIKDEFNRLCVQAILDEPDKSHTCKKVTTALVTNVVGALQSLCALDDDVELGTWLTDPDSSDEESYPRKENWVAVMNGILKIDELLEGQPESEYLIPHSPRWFSTVCMPFKFDWDAEKEIWSNYLRTSLEADDERINLLQEWAGYILTPSTDHQKFLILEGEGKNGKSVYLAAMEAMLGPQNVSHVPLEIFGQRFQLTSTLNKLANVCADCGEIDSIAEGYLKSFTSGDRMQFDRKGIAPVDATPTARLMIATNNRPRFSDKSQGLWRRMLLVPFNYEIPEEDRIPGMDKPAWWLAQPNELAGIFNWALLGLARLRENGRFTVPESCLEALEEYRLESNPAQVFLMEFYEERDPSEDQFANCTEVYSKYCDWCRQNGYRQLAHRTFGKEVYRAFKGVKRTRKGPRTERFWAYENMRHQDSVEELF